MTVINTITEKIEEVRKDLPRDWAQVVAHRMDLRPEVVYAYAKGRRGKRDKMKLLEILRQMKSLRQEFIESIEAETA